MESRGYSDLGQSAQVLSLLVWRAMKLDQTGRPRGLETSQAPLMLNPQVFFSTQ